MDGEQLWRRAGPLSSYNLANAVHCVDLVGARSYVMKHVPGVTRQRCADPSTSRAGMQLLDL